MQQVQMYGELSKEDRKWKKPNSISIVLKCSVCMDVFQNPTRLFCGHTFCWDCLGGWMKQSKSCPICRQTINKKNIGKDLLAFNIINTLQVYCIHSEVCAWEGTLDELDLHSNHECIFKGKKREQPKAELVDQEVEQKINSNTFKGNLLSRVMMKSQKIKNTQSFQVAKKLVTANTSELFEKENKQKKQNKGEKDQFMSPKHEAFDFLMELYQSK